MIPNEYDDDVLAWYLVSHGYGLEEPIDEDDCWSEHGTLGRDDQFYRSQNIPCP